MSALASRFPGAEEFYTVVPPTSIDLGMPAVGDCYEQKRDICWISNRAAEKWIVIAVTRDLITIQPERARWINGVRKVLLEILRKEYRFCGHQRQRPYN